MSNDNEIAQVFKAICDPTRVSILKFLKNNECCACEIGKFLNIAQSKLSYHMKILCESGMVEAWNVGKWTHYKINKEGILHAKDLLRTIVE